jgi:hypothetical protein
MIGYIEQCDQIASNLVKGGKKAEDISLDLLPAEYKQWWLQRFFPMNIQFMYIRHSEQ